MAKATAIDRLSGDEGIGSRALGSFERMKRFLQDVRTEMRKVTAPSTKEVRATTLVVIITTFLFAAYFYGVDRIVGFVVDKILAWAKAS